MMTVGELVDVLRLVDRAKVLYMPGAVGPEPVGAVVELAVPNITDTGVSRMVAIGFLPESALRQLEAQPNRPSEAGPLV